MPEQRLTGAVRVAVHAPDPVTRTGLVSCLQRESRIQEVPVARVAEADAVVVAVDRVDATTLDLLRALAAPDGTEGGEGAQTRFVMVVGRQWQADISAAVNQGVCAVVWRDSFTPPCSCRPSWPSRTGAGAFRLPYREH